MSFEWDKNINTYLGNKGYTVSKNDLSIKHQLKLKEMLTVKPYVPGSPVQVQKTFPAYRESANKMYLPRYFGEEIFGKPKEIKITEGDDIDLKFNGELRDYQIPVVNQFIEYVKAEQSRGGLLELPCAWGKTSASLYIGGVLKKKMLVIVGKEFLMNQWIERIQQFFPTARIGIIQGKIFDIEDKDIVICMLKSLVEKEYPINLFDSFGFTIFDEVHHISAESFSNSLFKVVTKYMLGLSATMDRKDGTTNVFKMFLGDIIFKGEKEGNHKVQVRAITYKSNDEEFNETVLDFRGKPQISTMISKICSYNNRTEFIIKVLTDFLEVDNIDKSEIDNHKKEMDTNNPNCEICSKNNNYLVRNICCDQAKYCLLCMDNIVAEAEIPIIIGFKDGIPIISKKRPKCPCCKKVLKYRQNYIENKYVKPLEQQQTLILSHNLNILDYIYNKMVCKNIASVGYYVGGMKNLELKHSEKQQVILATYSMASEALDIPRLNAEFFISSKTDIIQPVGRILRAKHKYSEPIIYDFRDTHQCFKNQWTKRKVYYIQQNYDIIECNKDNYTKDISSWKVVNKPNNCKKIIKEPTKIIKPLHTNYLKSIEEDTDTDTEENIDSDDDDDNNKPIGKCLIINKYKK